MVVVNIAVVVVFVFVVIVDSDIDVVALFVVTDHIILVVVSKC